MTTQDSLFTVSVYAAEEGGYWAEVLELPGCATQGETIDELRDNLMEVIPACLLARAAEESPPQRIAIWTLSLQEA